MQKLKKGEIIPLTFDPMFTEIFNDEDNICILEEFVAIYLNIELNKVRGNLKLLSRKLNRINKKDSKKEVDLLLDMKGEKINIELNNICNTGIIDRNIVYIGKVHGTQLKRGFKSYKEIKPTIQINLDNENHTNELIEEYYLKNKKGKILTKKLRIDILNLEKGSNMRYTNDERTNMLIRWCKVFISTTQKQLKEALKEIISNKSKIKLLEYVNKLSGDDEMVELYINLGRRELEYNTRLEEALENQEIEYNTRLEEALENQKIEYNTRLEEKLEKQEIEYEKNKFEIAKNLLKANVNIDIVSLSTGISKKELEKIK
ncbi:MAG: hypothetical protein J6K21_03090 [Bacilli bacterium]|nr:hypothetical protein [Bacilli bacterium]